MDSVHVRARPATGLPFIETASSAPWPCCASAVDRGRIAVEQYGYRPAGITVDSPTSNVRPSLAAITLSRPAASSSARASPSSLSMSSSTWRGS